MRRAALYARVSTRRQEREETIESQLECLQAYARERGDDIPPERRYFDLAVSGDCLARPGLDRLRDAALLGTFQVLYCLHPDRLARNLGVQQVVLDELRRLNIEVIFLRQPPLGDSPQAKLLLDIQGVFAEYERALISDRMRRGRLYRLRQQQAVPYPAPYGYRYQPASATQPSAWLVVPEQAAVVAQIFAWYTQEPLSLGQLAERLNGQHVPGPDGPGWHRGTLGRLLRQSAYRGQAYFARHQTDPSGVGQLRRHGPGRLRCPRYTRRPVEEWIVVPVPGLVDETTWQAAQARLAQNAQFAPRNSRRPYLLRGLLVCGVCDHTLQGRTQREVVYYTCPYGGQQRTPDTPPHTCSVRGDVVEPLIWQALTALLDDPQRLQTAWDTLRVEPSPAANEQQRWQQRHKQLHQQRQRLLDAYQAGQLSLAELTERQHPLVVELQTVEHQLADQTPPPPVQLALETFTQRMRQALTTADFETRQEVIRLLIERIVVTDEALTVEHIVPLECDSRLRLTFRET